ncbi:MAG TPA: hypothetical protein VGM41_21430 [Chitinophagaceae bacterium]|jgi:hypothetical protein
MKILLALLVTLTGYTLPAQITRSPLSSRYTAVGVCSQHFTDAFSGATNQAALATTTIPVAGVYGERMFMLDALGNYVAAIALPCSSGGIGFSMHYFGGPNFNTSQLGLGYGRKLGEKASLGAQINYNTMQVPGYGSAGTVNFELGTLFSIGEKWRMGIHVYNPTGGRFGKQAAEKLASVYTVGVGYEASDKFFIGADLNKEEDQPADAILAMQYVFAKQLLARAGISATGSNYFFGLGVKWKTFRVDAATEWHPQLGFTPGLMLLFDLKEKKETAGEP